MKKIITILFCLCVYFTNTALSAQNRRPIHAQQNSRVSAQNQTNLKNSRRRALPANNQKQRRRVAPTQTSTLQTTSTQKPIAGKKIASPIVVVSPEAQEYIEKKKNKKPENSLEMQKPIVDPELVEISKEKHERTVLVSKTQEEIQEEKKRSEEALFEKNKLDTDIKIKRTTIADRHRNRSSSVRLTTAIPEDVKKDFENIISNYKKDLQEIGKGKKISNQNLKSLITKATDKEINISVK